MGFEGTETKVVREQGTDNEKGDWEVRKLPAEKAWEPEIGSRSLR